ncbi:MAG: transporter substrate-binding domain-containing protein [Candidatus Omnitrophica bacterium]|nr:transporter substrate-binding domain-containing protein [Candidatus Omnitrophota bacterium]
MSKLLKWLSMSLVVLFMLAPLSYGETVKIIAEDDWYPYSAKIENSAKGIGVDVVRAVFKAEGIDVEFETMNYDRGMAMVKDGQAIGCFDAPRTKEIEANYLWHDEAMFPAASMIYAPADYSGSVKSVADLPGKILGLTQGYGYGDAIDSNDKITKEYSKSDDVIIKKLIAKRVDFIVLFEKVADYLLSKEGLQGQIKPVGPVESAQIYVAFSKSNPDGQKYRDIFSKGFSKIKADGTYQKIMDQWDAQLKAASEPAVAK